MEELTARKMSVVTRLLWVLLLTCCADCLAGQSIRVTVKDHEGGRFRHHYDTLKMFGFGLRWDDELVERNPDEPFTQSFTAESMRWAGWKTYEIPGFGEPNRGDIVVQVFRAQDYQPVGDPNYLSKQRVFSVPEPGAYIVRCAATVQVSGITHFKLSDIPGSATEVQGETPPGLPGYDSRGRYEVYRIKETPQGGRHAWTYYKRYTYWVIAETLTYVFPGETEDQALVVLPNDPDWLGQAAGESLGKASNKVVVHAFSPADESKYALIETGVSEGIQKILPQMAKLGDFGGAFFGGAAANIIVAGVFGTSLDDDFLLKAGIEAGITAGGTALLVSVGVSAGPAGLIVTGVILAVEIGYNEWKAFNMGAFYADDWIRDEVFVGTVPVEPLWLGMLEEFYDVSVCNHGTSLQNVYFVESSGFLWGSGDMFRGECNMFPGVSDYETHHSRSYITFDVEPFLRDLKGSYQSIRKGHDLADPRIIRDLNRWYDGSVSGDSREIYGFYMPPASGLSPSIRLEVGNPSGWDLVLVDRHGLEQAGFSSFPISGGRSLDVTGLTPGPYFVIVSGPGGAYRLGFEGFPDVFKPATVVSVIDVSGSMNGAKLTLAKSACNDFIDMMNTGDKIGIVSFSSSASAPYPLTQIGDPAGTVKNAAKLAVNALSAGGSTAMGLGVRAGNNELKRFPSDRNRVMIVMTDGEETDAPYAAEVIDSDPVANDIQVFMIGFGVTESTMRNLRLLAEKRNGQAYAAPTAQDLRDVYFKIIGAGMKEPVAGLAGTINPGGQVTQLFHVDASTASLSADLSYPGSDLDLILTDPDGNEIPRQTDDAAGIEFINRPTSETYLIKMPTPGTWRATVIGVDVPSEDYPFNLHAFAQSQVETRLTVAPGPHAGRTPVDIVVEIDDGAPVSGVSVIAEVTPPEDSGADRFVVGLEELEPGLYVAAFDRTRWGGDYAVNTEVEGRSSLGFWFSRSQSTSFNVIAPPNLEPVAVAGPNQTVYAHGDGMARVLLDGSGSYDPDDDPLEYTWSCATGSTFVQVAGVSSAIALPPGEHTISLVVNDGLEDSEPNEVHVTVLPPLEGRLFLWPKTMHLGLRKSPIVTGLLRLPGNIRAADVRPKTATCLPAPLAGRREWLFGRWCLAVFSVNEAAFSNNTQQVMFEVQLNSGRFVYDTETVRVRRWGK